MKVKVIPGSVCTVVRDGVRIDYLGGTACEVSEDEARANVSILTDEDGAPLNLPPLPPPGEAAAEVPATSRSRRTSADN